MEKRNISKLNPYENTEFTLGDLNKMDHTLRDVDLNTRVKGKGGVLRNSVLNGQKMYVTYDYATLLHVLSNGDVENKKKKNLRSMATSQSKPERGGLIIPYIPADAKQDTVITQRLKPTYTKEDKEFAEKTGYKLVKYLSALGSENEPYIARFMVDEQARKLVIDELITEACKNNPSKTKEEIVKCVETALNLGKFEKLKTALNDKDVPLIVIEGEYKGLALAQTMIETHARNIQKVIDKNNNVSECDLEKVGYCAPVALIGVNGLIKASGGKKTRTYDFIESFKKIIPERREIIVGLDNDCDKNVAVAFSAVSVAVAADKLNSKVRLLVPPKTEKKLGWDDYIYDNGIEKTYTELNKIFNDTSKLKEVDKSISWKDCEKARDEGRSVLDAICEKDKRKEIEKEDKSQMMLF